MTINRKRNLSARAVVTAVALIAVACGEAGPEPDAGADQAVAIAATVAVAELAEVEVVASASGSTEAWRRSSPGTKIMGRVREISVREGDHVTGDQVVVQIESADLEAALAQARAALVMAEATLENAATHHERMRALHAQQSVTDKSLEDASAAHRVAAASAEVMRANIQAAEVAVSYAIVRTPIAGWVTSKLIEVGDMAAPGQALLVVADLSRVKVKVDVPESVVVELSRGQTAEVTVMGTVRPATIERVRRSGDVATRTFAVEMVLENPDGTLKEGMFARAAFDTGKRSALLVPLTAVVERGQLVGVFVLDEDGRAGLRWVRLGTPRQDDVEVLSGLQPGERYLVAPTSAVHDGAHIETTR